MSESVSCLVAADLFFQARLANGLRRLGYIVLTASSVEQVLTRAREAAPSLLILDLGARSFDWQETLRRVRADEALRALPILAFGSHTDEQVHQEARDLGATLTCSNGAISMNLGEMVSRALAAAA